MAERSTGIKRAPLRLGIVDDHRLVLDCVASYLGSRRSEFDVAIAADSWEGLVSHDEFPVDVVVLDLNLGDGIPLSSKIQALTTAGARTVVMSRQSDAASINGALAAGAISFVAKSESAIELVAAIRAGANGESHLGEAVGRLLREATAADDPGLGTQERRALMLYATGRSIREVAEEMTTTEETVKSYIKRARRKYRSIGVDLGSKLLLRRRGVQEGWLSPE